MSLAVQIEKPGGGEKRILRYGDTVFDYTLFVALKAEGRSRLRFHLMGKSQSWQRNLFPLSR